MYFFQRLTNVTKLTICQRPIVTMAQCKRNAVLAMWEWLGYWGLFGGYKMEQPKKNLPHSSLPVPTVSEAKNTYYILVN
jgi:hypothetical protein